MTPTSPAGNENLDCADLVELGFISGFDDEDKTGDSPSGDVDLEHSSVNVTGDVVSFEADDGWLVVAVNVKGGDEGSNIYDYETATLNGVDHDNGLTTPTGQGVSHVTLCLIEGPEATPTPTPEGTQGGGTSTPTPTPEGTQAGGTGTPAPSVPNTALSLTGSGSLATIFFGAVLIASLGALAYANVTAVRRRR